MTLIARRDSDGHEFVVWSQEQAGTCAVAAVWMARSMVTQSTLHESEWELAWRMYHNAVAGGTWRMPSSNPAVAPPAQSFDHRQFQPGRHTFENTVTRSGFDSNHVCTMLIQEGFSAENIRRTDTNVLTIDTNRLCPTTPAIVEVGWYRPTGQGAAELSSAHAIVAARKTNTGSIVYLDPAYGRLVERLNDGRYGDNGYIDSVTYVSRRA